MYNLELIYRNNGIKIWMLNFLFKMMVRILPIVGLLLSIPLIAMQLTDEVNWSFFDFIIMGTLLTITGLLIGIVLKKVKYYKYREVFIVIIVMLFLLIWAELAVGLFGTPFAGDWLCTNHPNKKKPPKASSKERFIMSKLAFEPISNKIQVSRFELESDLPSYTYNTIKWVFNQHENSRVSIITVSYTHLTLPTTDWV